MQFSFLFAMVIAHINNDHMTGVFCKKKSWVGVVVLNLCIFEYIFREICNIWRQYMLPRITQKSTPKLSYLLFIPWTGGISLPCTPLYQHFMATATAILFQKMFVTHTFSAEGTNMLRQRGLVENMKLRTVAV